VPRLVIVLASLAVAVAASATASSTSAHTVNLATGQLDGHTILGLTPSQVSAVLGKPDAAHGTKSRYVLQWGGGSPPHYEVIFTKHGASERAVTLALETGAYQDPKIGNILKPTPAAFASLMQARYGRIYRILKPLSHQPGGRSSGEFVQRSGSLHVSFGSRPNWGTFITLWQTG